MDTKDSVIEKTELVINVLDYAHAHNLNINNKDDVKKILKVLDLEHTSEEEVEEFVKLLQAANTLMEKDVERKRNTN